MIFLIAKTFPRQIKLILRLQRIVVLSFIGLMILSQGIAAQETELIQEPILRLNTGQHTAPVIKISVDQKQRYLVTGSHDKTVGVYRIETGRLLKTLRLPLGDGGLGGGYAVAISPDGDSIAAGGQTGSAGNRSIYILDRKTGKMMRRISGLPNIILHLAYSPDGAFLAASLKGGSGIRIFATKNYQQVFSDDDYANHSAWVSFDAGNRLVSSSFDGHIRLYHPVNAAFKRIEKNLAPGGERPFSVAFSPDGKRIAIGYDDMPRVDVLSSEGLQHLFSANTKGFNNGGLSSVAWSPDGRYLYAGGRFVLDGGWFPVLTWEDGGRGDFKMLKVATDTVMDIVPLSDGRLAIAAADPLVGVLGNDGEALWKRQRGIADFRGQVGKKSIRLSEKGDIVQFGFQLMGKDLARFSFKMKVLTLDSPVNKNLTLPMTEAPGLNITDWQDKPSPLLNGKPLALEKDEIARSLAITPLKNRFLLGTDRFLRLFDLEGNEVWRTAVPAVAWTVNITRDGRLAVAGFGDGTLRWYRIKDGVALLALFAHPDGRRWIAWTPEGYYDTSAGGEDLIGWQLNNGEDKSPDFFAASRFRKPLYRPDIINQVLNTLDVSEAVKVSDKARGKESPPVDIEAMQPPVISIIFPESDEKQKETKLVVTYKAQSKQGPITAIKAKVNGSWTKILHLKRDYFDERKSVVGVITLEIPAKDVRVNLIATNKHGASEPATYSVSWDAPPDFRKPKLFVLAIGVTRYQDKRYNTLHYPAKDARDFVNALKTQKGWLYKDIAFRLLLDSKATRNTILDELDWLVDQTTARDVAMVFLAGHGRKRRKDGRYRFLPHDAKPGHLNGTSVDANELKERLTEVKGQTVLFMDTCHSGRLMASERGTDTLQDTDGFVNELKGGGVTVFASSTGRQLSIENKLWENGAFTEALLEGIKTRKADSSKDFYVSISELDVFVSKTVDILTRGRQTPVTNKPNSVADFHVVRVLEGG